MIYDRLHESIGQKVYWIGRLRRRAKYLQGKLTERHNEWELKELQALNYAIRECRAVVKTEIKMFHHWCARFEKTVPGAESNGKID